MLTWRVWNGSLQGDCTVFAGWTDRLDDFAGLTDHVLSHTRSALAYALLETAPAAGLYCRPVPVSASDARSPRVPLAERCSTLARIVNSTYSIHS